MAVELHASTAATTHTTSHEQRIVNTEVRVNAIVRQGGTGQEYGRGIDVPGEKRADHVKITDKINTEYRTNLVNVANAFRRVNPDVLSDPRFAKERMLIDQISDTHGNVDNAKLDAFLSTDTGWALANGFIGTNIMMHEMALIAAASTLPPGQREMLMGGEKPFVSRVKDKLSNMPLIGSRITPDGENTALSKGRGAVHKAIDAIGAFKDPNSGGLLKEGMRVRYEYDVDTFKAIMGEPEVVDAAGTVIRPATLKDTKMIETIKALTNIDLNDYEVVGGQVRPKGEATNALQTGMSARKIESELKELVHARRDFLENGCGVAPKLIEGSPGQWLREGGIREFTGVLLDDAVYQEFLNMGGLVDQANYTQNSPDFRRGTIAPGTEGLWTAKNLRRYNEAYSRVLGREMENYVEELSGSNASKRFDNLRTLQEDLAIGNSVDSGGERYKKVRDELEAKKAGIDGQVGQLETTKGKLDKVKESKDRLAEARDTLDTLLIRQFDPRLFAGGVRDPNIAIQALNNVLGPTGGRIMIEGRMIYSPTVRREALDLAIRTEVDTIAGPGTRVRGETDKVYTDRHASASEATKAKYEDERAAIEADAVLLRGLMQKITTEQGNIRQAQEALLPTTEDMQAAAKVMQELPDAYTKVLSIGVVVTRGGVPSVTNISEADLRTMTTPELMGKVNEIYKKSKGSVGWPESRNSENLNMVLNAAAELRARDADASLVIKGPNPRLSDMRILTSAWGIPELQIMTMTEDELNRLMDEKDTKSGGRLSPIRVGGALNPNWIDRAHLQEVIDAANERFSLRNRALQEEVSGRKEASKRVEEEISQINFGKLGEQVDAAMVMAKNQDPMLGKRDAIVREPGKYFNVQDIATATEPLTAAEKKVKAPIGYLEMVDVFFDYKSKGAGREEAFKKAATFLPPKKLADYLNREFKLTVAPGADYEKRVFDEMQVRVKARRSTYGATTIDAIDMRRGLMNILNRLVDETIITKP